MGWLLKVMVIWLSIDIVTLATYWYATTEIRPRFPDWWRRVIVDEEWEVC